MAGTEVKWFDLGKKKGKLETNLMIHSKRCHDKLELSSAKFNRVEFSCLEITVEFIFTLILKSHWKNLVFKVLMKS